MELHLHSHRLEARAPDWMAAMASGFLAGAILMVLELLWSTNQLGVSPWATSHLVAAMVLGRDVLSSTDFVLSVVAVALMTHYLLGILFGVILAAIIAPFHFDSSPKLAVVIGSLFGVALYMTNFYGMAYFFPWMIEARGWFALTAHLIFGISTAWLYCKIERKAD